MSLWIFFERGIKTTQVPEIDYKGITLGLKNGKNASIRQIHRMITCDHNITGNLHLKWDRDACPQCSCSRVEVPSLGVRSSRDLKINLGGGGSHHMVNGKIIE